MEPSEDDLGASVENLLVGLGKERGFLEGFMAGGGYLELYVTYGPERPGEVVLPGLMKQLADQNVALGIDWVRS